jgi:hypothetical protein
MITDKMIQAAAEAIVAQGIGELSFDQWPDEMQTVFRRQARAALTAALSHSGSVPAVPEGWQLVPLQATKEMEEAAVAKVKPYHDVQRWHSVMPGDLFRLAWPALLEKAPAAPALSHSPVEQETGTGAEVSKFHEWNGNGVCQACGCSFAGLRRIDPCPSSAPIAHTFHIDPVSGESVRDEVEGTPAPVQHVVGLPQDVITLVIAAREFWDINNDLSDESAALDKALEAYADRVPYENGPGAG